MNDEQRIAVLEQAVGEPNDSGPPSTAELASWSEAEVERLGGLDKEGRRRSLTASLPILAGWSESALTRLLRIGLVFRLSTARWEVVRDEGLLAGLRDGDVLRLRDATWTMTRLKLGSTLTSRSGYDHSAVSWAVLEALAFGDGALVDEYLPPGTPPAAKGRPTMRTIVNTVVALRHGEHLEDAVAQADHAATIKSNTQYERLMSRYLHDLLADDRSGAETALAEIARTWASTPWIRNWNFPIIKDLGLKLHGLVALGESCFPGIEQVAHGTRGFSPRLAEMVRSFPDLSPPTPVVTFTGACDVANAMLQERPLSALRAWRSSTYEAS